MPHSWTDLTVAAPAFAEAVAGHMAGAGASVLGTIGTDGSPRLTTVEAPVRGGHLWLQVRALSAVQADLERDARFTLHVPPPADPAHGALTITGRALPVEPAEDLWQVRWAGDAPPDPGTMLYRADLITLSLQATVQGMVRVRTWTPDGGLVDTGVA